MDDYGVTGARVELEMTVPLPPKRLWDLITEVPRISDWSPECRHIAWLDPTAPELHLGSRFQCRNLRQGAVWTTTCTVTELAPPRAFAWTVLDDRDHSQLSSTWRYDLKPAAPDQTLVHHTFVHGPGRSLLRDYIEATPEIAAIILDVRLTELHTHMTETLDAMTRSA
ncbi:SRPBCC family protein [Sphaerisporangium aureirubrum]|uniref:SRPBCC family protein n=1 Tax=Sphaerisporangium aureirubrum TaxID=1544736 RepID=A0ABW1NL26_9ACTN